MSIFAEPASAANPVMTWTEWHDGPWCSKCGKERHYNRAKPGEPCPQCGEDLEKRAIRFLWQNSGKQLYWAEMLALASEFETKPKRSRGDGDNRGPGFVCKYCGAPNT